MKILLVLLAILKGIGIFLLAVILLLLLILFLLLFTPIGYGATGEKNEKSKGSFFVTWLFGMLHMAGAYEEGGEITLSGKVCGFSFLGERAERRREKKRKKKRDKAHKKRKKQKEEGVLLSAREKKMSTEKQELERQPIVEKIEQPQHIIEEQKEKGKEEPQEEPNEKKQENVETKEEKIPLSAMDMGINKGIIRRVKMVDIKEIPPAEETTFEEETEFLSKDSFEETGKEDKGKKEKWKQYYRQFQNIQNKKQILKAVIRFVKRVFKNILPRNLLLKATIGTGDPSLTGQLLGAVGIAKAKFGKNLQVKGDFSKADVRDVEIRVKGRMYLGSLVVGLGQLVLAKPVWALIKQYRKGKR